MPSACAVSLPHPIFNVHTLTLYHPGHHTPITMASHECGETHEGAASGGEDMTSVQQLPGSHGITAGGQAALSGPRKRRVSYFYQGDVGHYYYGPGHPMKPHRLKLTHHLLLSYDLYKHLTVYVGVCAAQFRSSRFELLPHLPHSAHTWQRRRR